MVEAVAPAVVEEQHDSQGLLHPKCVERAMVRSWVAMRNKGDTKER